MTVQTRPDPAASEPVAADGGPRIHGVVDVMRPNRVAGWAIDRTDPAAQVAVRLEREGRTVAETRADRPRADLEKAGVGTGRYGFSLPLDPPLEPGMAFTLTVVARAADGAETRLRAPKADGDGAETRLLERVFAETRGIRAALDALEGRLDAAGPEARQALERVEILQVRLEAVMATMEPPPAPGHAGLWALAGAALLVAFASLALGLASLWVS